MPDRSHHALLVIDVQNDFLNDVPNPDTYRRSLEQLLSFCRTSGIMVYHLRVSRETDRSNWMPFEILRGRAPGIRDTVGAETPPWAEAITGEPVIYKDALDGFLRTDLDDRLHAAGIRHVLIAGLVTSVCVLATSMAAVQRGYLVTVVSDCVADEEPDHLDTLQRYGGFVFGVVQSWEIADARGAFDTQIRDLDHKRQGPGRSS